MEFTSLRGNLRFKAVYDGGRSAAGRCFVMFVLKNTLGLNRLGITVTKKIGNAVVRNRVRRVVREGFRLDGFEWPSGYDIIVLVRRPAVSAGLNNAMKELSFLRNKLGI